MIPGQGSSPTRVIFSGIVDLEQGLGALEALCPDGAYTDNKRLWDLRGCTIELSNEELKLGAEQGRAREDGPAKVAFLVDQDLNFGLARVHEVHRETERTDSRVFRDETEALTWLAED